MKFESKFDPGQRVQIKGTNIRGIVLMVIGTKVGVSYEIQTRTGQHGTIQECNLESAPSEDEAPVKENPAWFTKLMTQLKES